MAPKVSLTGAPGQTRKMRRSNASTRKQAGNKKASSKDDAAEPQQHGIKLADFPYAYRADNDDQDVETNKRRSTKPYFEAEFSDPEMDSDSWMTEDEDEVGVNLPDDQILDAVRADPRHIGNVNRFQERIRNLCDLVWFDRQHLLDRTDSELGDLLPKDEGGRFEMRDDRDGDFTYYPERDMFANGYGMVLARYGVSSTTGGSVWKRHLNGKKLWAIEALEGGHWEDYDAGSRDGYSTVDDDEDSGDNQPDQSSEVDNGGTSEVSDLIAYDMEFPPGYPVDDDDIVY